MEVPCSSNDLKNEQEWLSANERRNRNRSLVVSRGIRESKEHLARFERFFEESAKLSLETS